MTRLTMTEHEQRIAIARWMGDSCQSCQQPLSDEMLPDTCSCKVPSVPDYTRDLNAMAAAEMHMRGTPEQYHNDEVIHRRWHSYVWFLNKDHGPCATAAQRAEALLRTLGLWKEAAP